MYDKIYKGTFLGGSLTTAIKTKTGGILFIPAHLVAEVVDGTEKTHVKNIFRL